MAKIYKLKEIFQVDPKQKQKQKQNKQKNPKPMNNYMLSIRNSLQTQ